MTARDERFQLLKNIVTPSLLLMVRHFAERCARLLGLTSFLLAVSEWPAGCIVFLGVGVQRKGLASLQPGAYAMAIDMLGQVGLA